MTKEYREYAKSRIEYLLKISSFVFDERDKEALEAAIKALSQEPCDDAISREMALKECHDIVVDGERYRVIQEETLLGLPPVTQKSGKWIEHPEIETSMPEDLMFYECSECGDKQCYFKADTYRRRFCGVCGAKMESEE